MNVTALIMAAGMGTRMRSKTPKVLHPICGRALLHWPITAAEEAGITDVVVICSPDERVKESLPDWVKAVEQPQALGTGDAIKCARDCISADSDIVILSGDHPLVNSETVKLLIDEHRESDAVATLATAELDDPSGYGRIVRDSNGEFLKIVETKVQGDASESELGLNEINTGLYCFKGGRLLEELEKLEAGNAQNEIYLGDVLPPLIESGEKVVALKMEDSEFALGINTRVGLAVVTDLAQQRILRDLMLGGVTVVDPRSTQIDVGVRIGADTVIEPFSSIKGVSEIGSDVTIGPATSVQDSRIGDGSSVAHSFLVECIVGRGCSVGPFAYLRPGAQLGDGAKAGTFVEIKNSQIGAGTKVPHLSYIGDADVGDEANIGAGNITANYDGNEKHRTKIGDRVKTGVDTSFVAPVAVGDDAYTGAGSVIDEDVPEGALGISRAAQKNVDGYAERKKKKEQEE